MPKGKPEKAVLWFVHEPGMTYAGNLRYRVPVSIDYVKDDWKHRNGYKRLPRGTEFWIAR